MPDSKVIFNPQGCGIEKRKTNNMLIFNDIHQLFMKFYTTVSQGGTEIYFFSFTQSTALGWYTSALQAEYHVQYKAET